MKKTITNSGVLLTGTKNFSMGTIVDSGQCFRWRKLGHMLYEGVAFDKYLQVYCDPEEGVSLFKCSESEFNSIWYDYFDFDRDYQSIIDMIPASDEFLSDAGRVCSGLRILKQDPWECLISFIISQQNNIPRITKIIENLCRLFGELKYNHEDKPYYTFPTPQQIIDKHHLTSKVGLGYRDKYVLSAAISVSDELSNFYQLGELDNESCINELKKFYGVGDKVANCISLFGFHNTDAFPIDVWIRRIINDVYNGSFDCTEYSPYSGIIQQYMFYYYRLLNKLF